jgi:uncharacterized Zn-binding protein involved in type VI secretion|tara:strand:- start:679 stop:945 length:267 start_codon:yes stop_codon:yes gene_type:complete
MANLSRKGDIIEGGHKLKRGSSNVFVNDIEVCLHESTVDIHGPKNSHKSVTTQGSPSVEANGVPVVRTGTPTSCGHSVITGSPDVECP